MKIIALLLIVGLNASCQQPVKNTTQDSADSLSAFLKNGKGILLDVRTPGEFSEEHIPGAININYNDTGFTAALDTLDKDQSYAVYCRSGRRSGDAIEIMKAKGFKNIQHLEGGILKWKEKGLRTVK